MIPKNSFQSPLPLSKEGLFSPGGPTSTFNPPTLDTATKNCHLNHLALRITEPARSLHFYIDLLGMRVIFSMNAGPFTIYYLGHPPPETQDGEVGKWAGETAEIPVLMRTKGLLELYHVHGTENGIGESGSSIDERVTVSNGNVPPHLGFAHLGFTVPDVGRAVERLRGAGVTILKEPGVYSRESVPLSEWEAGRGVGVGEIHEDYAWFFEKFAMVADPDGYMVELIPQHIQG